MGRFLEPLPNLVRLDDKDRWGRPLYMIDADLLYEVGHPDSGVLIRIEQGTRNNLATIPTRFLRWVFRGLCHPKSPHVFSVVMHDALTGEYSKSLGYSRFEADAFLRSGMDSTGYHPLKAWLVYHFGVRLYAKFWTYLAILIVAVVLGAL